MSTCFHFNTYLLKFSENGLFCVFSFTHYENPISFSFYPSCPCVDETLIIERKDKRSHFTINLQVQVDLKSYQWWYAPFQFLPDDNPKDQNLMPSNIISNFGKNKFLVKHMTWNVHSWPLNWLLEYNGQYNINIRRNYFANSGSQPLLCYNVKCRLRNFVTSTYKPPI